MRIGDTKLAPIGHAPNDSLAEDEAVAQRIREAPYRRATDRPPYAVPDMLLVREQRLSAYARLQELRDGQRDVHNLLADSLGHFFEQREDSVHGMPAMQAHARALAEEADRRGEVVIDVVREKMLAEAQDQALNGPPAADANGLQHLIRAIVLTGDAEKHHQNLLAAKYVYALYRALDDAMRKALPHRHEETIKALAALSDAQLERAEARIGNLAPETSGRGRRRRQPPAAPV